MDNARDNAGGTEPSYLDGMTGPGEAGERSSLDALGRALRVGFRVLRVLMVLLAVIFVFSNIYWVSEGTVAVQCRFGRMTRARGRVARPPGGPYLALPHPIDRVVRIPTTIQKVSVYRAFWDETAKAEPEIDDRQGTQGLRPGVHGSLVTADKHIVQGVWVVNFKLRDDAGGSGSGESVADFVQNVGSMSRAANLVGRLAEAAIVRVVSQTTVPDFVAGRIDNARIQSIMDAALARLETGLKVTNVSAAQYAAPKALMADFQAVTQAESEKAFAIEKATRHRLSTLSEVAGSGWRELLAAVDGYGEALQGGDPDAEREAFKSAKEALLSGFTGGYVAQLLDEARSEKTETIQRARASAARFAELLPSCRENPQILKAQLLQDAVEEIWSDVSVKAVRLPRDQKLYLELGEERAEFR
jgi:regulator of protease activity HflC (stomatin/prohibitin superfamily)